MSAIFNQQILFLSIKKEDHGFEHGTSMLSQVEIEAALASLKAEQQRVIEAFVGRSVTEYGKLLC